MKPAYSKRKINDTATKWKIFSSLLLFGMIYLHSLKAQTFKFQIYDTHKEICHPFVYSITQDNHGFIWVLTGTGICRFDGFNFLENGGSKDSLPECSAEISYKDKNNHLWFGYNDGSLVRFTGNSFRLFKPSAGEYGRITGIISDEKGNILAANQNSGIIVISSDFKKTIIKSPFQDKLIFSFNIAPDNKILVGTDEGLFIYRFDGSNCKYLYRIEGLPQTKINRIIKQKKENSFWLATEDSGLFILTFKGQKYSLERFRPDLLKGNVQSVFEDRAKNIWISTIGTGLFKISAQGETINFNSSNGLGRDDIKETYQDTEGNIWVATFGNGIVKIPRELFFSYNLNKEFKDNNITAVCFDKSGYWVGGTNGILKIECANHHAGKYFGISSGLPADKVTSLFIDPKETLWIGTEKNGIYRMASGSSRVSPFFRSGNSLANSINSISGFRNMIFAGTKNGLYKFFTDHYKIEHYSTTEGLPHNDIRSVYVDTHGIVWIATHSSQLFALNNPVKYDLKGAGEIEFSGVARDFSGNIWSGTNGNGIFRFRKDSFHHFTTRNGLKSDYCYAMISDKAGNIWIGHRMGVSKINSGTQQIKTFSNEFFSGDVNFNAMSSNNHGDIIFGTTEGLVYYEASDRTNQSVPPSLNILSLSANDSVFNNISRKITLPYAAYRIKIDYIGLNYDNPEQVTYQFKLEGFDNEWSEPSKTREIRYPRLEDGSYTFFLKAVNSDGLSSETRIDIQIKKPFWKKWWFYGLILLSIIFLVDIIIRFREKRQKEFQAHLEKMLDERTREVREQKEEIEIINRDITDSINYAQRIQSSILPSLRKLQNLFTGSFVYYLPRNIVSGDFYWFDVTPQKDKLVIVCADSTGHGVPGAFMSLIGTTLLKDIFMRPEVTKPSDLLLRLDKELRSILNQNLEGERPNDGMDIIVCEIDLKTHYARFSSAMRPFIVYQNGELLYFKGSKSSIGGQIKEDKIFEDVELQLSKGDLIYMFSDGYPDQFGGPSGKKLKMVRLRNMLKDIYQKPMEDQYNQIKLNFELWKGDLDQVDDVLFMGIKI